MNNTERQAGLPTLSLVRRATLLGTVSLALAGCSMFDKGFDPADWFDEPAVSAPVDSHQATPSEEGEDVALPAVEDVSSRSVQPVKGLGVADAPRYDDENARQMPTEVKPLEDVAADEPPPPVADPVEPVEMVAVEEAPVPVAPAPKIAEPVILPSPAAPAEKEPLFIEPAPKAPRLLTQTTSEPVKAAPAPVVPEPAPAPTIVAAAQPKPDSIVPLVSMSNAAKAANPFDISLPGSDPADDVEKYEPIEGFPASAFADPDMSSVSILALTLHHAHGSTAVPAAEKAGLKKVLAMHKQHGGVIRVVGHASSRTRDLDPIEHKMANLKVSMKRADSVRAALIKLGAKPASIVATGVSDNEPIYYEMMPSGEALNRRTEIYLDY